MMDVGYVDIYNKAFAGEKWYTVKMCVVDGDKRGFAAITVFEDRWDLDHLWAITRGGGRVALTYVCELADQARAPIELIYVPDVSPGGICMTAGQLKKWYMSFGFSDDDQYFTGAGNDLRREPR